MDPRFGDRAEHPPVHLRHVRDMLAERRDDVHVGLGGERLVKHLRQAPGPRMGSRDVGREQQHAPGSFAEALSRLARR